MTNNRAFVTMEMNPVLMGGGGESLIWGFFRCMCKHKEILAKITGTGPVKYLQDEKVFMMFADCNKFGKFSRILAGRIKFEMSWQLELVSFKTKRKKLCLSSCLCLGANHTVFKRHNY